MGVILKSQDEIKIMAEAGKILSDIEEEIADLVEIGISTEELDQKANDLCKKNNVKPAFLGYRGFPKTLCVGVNDVVVHGIPSESEVLEEGDIISIDMGVIYEDYYSDRAVTVGVGEISKEASKFLEISKEALYKAIKEATVRKTLGDIGNAIQTTLNQGGYSVVRQMVGHGIGKNLHEEPHVPGFGTPGEGMKLESGMTIAIEIIANEKGSEIVFEKDGWTTRTKDGSLSALFEHTIAVTEKEALILTK